MTIRFAAHVNDPTTMANVLATVEKLGPSWFLCMAPACWSIGLVAEGMAAHERERAFVTFNTSAMFSDYVIESDNNNCRGGVAGLRCRVLTWATVIPLIVNISNLIRALRSSQGALETYVVLEEKNNHAFLTFEIRKVSSPEQVGRGVQQWATRRRGMMRVCDKAFPSSYRWPAELRYANRVCAGWIVTRTLLCVRKDFEEPRVESPDVKIKMPNLRILSRIIDRMKSVRSSTLEA